LLAIVQVCALSPNALRGHTQLGWVDPRYQDFHVQLDHAADWVRAGICISEYFEYMFVFVCVYVCCFFKFIGFLFVGSFGRISHHFEYLTL
jgi:hypothetical protein